MLISEFKDLLIKVIGNGKEPVVVFAALWPLQRILNIPKIDLTEKVASTLTNIVLPDRSLLMPTFSNGFTDGISNLDTEPSLTGILSEYFRLHPKSQRSFCPFFSYSIQGPDTEEVIKLRPSHAWGKGSVFEWFEKKNARFIMIGTNPAHCSYLHRVEWLEKEVVSYRYEKEFSGIVRYCGKDILLKEKLFVRNLDPEVINDYQPIVEDLRNNGMTLLKAKGVSLAAMNALDMRNSYSRLLRKDPFITVKNRDDFIN